MIFVDLVNPGIRNTRSWINPVENHVWDSN